MDSERQRIRIALLANAIVWASVLSVSGCIQSPTPSYSIFRPAYTPVPIQRHDTQIPSKASKAHQKSMARALALARYQFLERLEPTFGYIPIKDTDNVAVEVLFPIRRSDRVYLFFRLGYSTSPTGSAIVCYQHIDGQDKLAYQINLDGQTRLVPTAQRPKKVTPMKSLLDYITLWTSGYTEHGVDHEGHLVLMPPVSPLAQQDLATKRDYAMYNYNPAGMYLTIYRLSHRFAYEGKLYHIYEDPMTKAKLTSDEFFATYGLPIAKGELFRK